MGVFNSPKPPLATPLNARFRGSVCQLKLLSRPTDALVRNASTGNLCTMLSYKACKIYLITAIFYHLQGLWLKGRLKMHFLQVECKSSSRSGGGSRPLAKGRSTYVMSTYVKLRFGGGGLD